MTARDERFAQDLADVEGWQGVQRGVLVRLVDGSALTLGNRLVVAVPAPETPADPELVRADTAAAFKALGWRRLTVEVAQPARVHRPVTAHRRLSATGRVDAAIRTAGR